MSGRTAKARTDGAVEWLLEADPAIRWQTLRDLAGASSSSVERERNKVAREGWGARLLAKQDAKGTWAGRASPDSGLYTPSGPPRLTPCCCSATSACPPPTGKREPAARSCSRRDSSPDGGINYGTWAKWIRRSETCITGMVLSILSHFRFRDARLDVVAGHLLEHQLADGGWNCRAGATHSSVHTTISALEGLRHYELHRGQKGPEIREAQRRGQEFLLVHRLFRSHRTGKIIKPEFTRFSFPPRWHYDILRALDYFQSVNAPRDSRLEEAIEILHSRRGSDGRWPLQHTYHGKTYFQLERVGAPSRWNTLRALRVLKWWEDS